MIGSVRQIYAVASVFGYATAKVESALDSNLGNSSIVLDEHSLTIYMQVLPFSLKLFFVYHSQYICLQGIVQVLHHNYWSLPVQLLLEVFLRIQKIK